MDDLITLLKWLGRLLNVLFTLGFVIINNKVRNRISYLIITRVHYRLIDACNKIFRSLLSTACSDPRPNLEDGRIISIQKKNNQTHIYTQTFCQNNLLLIK